MNKRKTLGYWKLDSEMASGGKGYKSHSFSYLRKRGQTSLDMFLLWTPNAELPVGVACPFSLKNWDLLPCIQSGVSQPRAGFCSRAHKACVHNPALLFTEMQPADLGTEVAMRHGPLLPLDPLAARSQASTDWSLR